MKITTKHVRNSPVTFVTHERSAVFFFLPFCCVNSLIAELRRTKRASGAPWVRKFGYDVAYARTLFAGEGRESDVSPSGRGVCCKSRDAFVQPAFFLAGNRPRNGVAVVAFRNMFTSAETCPLLLHAHLRRWRKWHYHISLYFWLAHEGEKVITLLSQ